MRLVGGDTSFVAWSLLHCCFLFLFQIVGDFVVWVMDCINVVVCGSYCGYWVWVGVKVVGDLYVSQCVLEVFGFMSRW